MANAAQLLDTQIRGSEFAVVAHGLRDMADRLENTERRAQQSIASVNQSVAAMQDRIDAAERVKQLADVAFTSAADALAQSARDQSMAFDSLELTMRALQKRLSEVENGRADAFNKDALNAARHRARPIAKASERGRERARGFVKQGCAVAHRHGARAVAEALERDARRGCRQRQAVARRSQSNFEIHARSEFARRLDRAFVVAALGADKSLFDAVGARVDALEARAASQFDELRGAIAKTGVPPDSLAALKRSVDTLTSRIDAVGDTENGPLAGPIGAIESTLETLTSKIEESDKRAAELASTVSAVLKSFSSGLRKPTSGKRSRRRHWRASSTIRAMSSKMR